MCSPEETLGTARIAMEQLAQHRAHVLVLTDVFGATPCNVAQKLVDGVKSRLITGVNLPMLLRSVSYRARIARGAGGARRSSAARRASCRSRSPRRKIRPEKAMIKTTTTISNKLGLHARASAKLTKLAGSFPCEVWIAKGERRVNAKSIMGVMMLAAGIGSERDHRDRRRARAGGDGRACWR